jgi:hypothetical protein
MNHPDYSRPAPPPGYVATADVAAAHSHDRRSICRWCRQHPHLAIRVDGRWWVHPERLADFLRSRAGAGHAKG